MNKLFGDSRSMSEDSIEKSSDPAKFVIEESFDDTEEDANFHKVNALSSTRFDLNVSGRRSLNMTKIGRVADSPAREHISDTESDIEQFYTPSVERTMNPKEKHQNQELRTPKFVVAQVILDSDSDKENGSSNKTKSLFNASNREMSKQFFLNQTDNKSYREKVPDSDDEDSVEITFDKSASVKKPINVADSSVNFSEEESSIKFKPKSRKKVLSDSEEGEKSKIVDESTDKSLEQSIQGLIFDIRFFFT